MLPRTTDTIAAIATAPGRGGIGIVRISGTGSRAIAASLCGDCPPPRQASLRVFRASDFTVIDQGLILYFPGPASFTGEDIIELHAHGGPIVLDMLLEAVLCAGARLAEPGEFSLRAFLNGKIDLVQAEAIADLIDSGSRSAARGALRNLQGEFSQRISLLVSNLIDLRVYIEASIDFPEEEVDFLSDSQVRDNLYKLIAQLRELQSNAEQGCLIREGLNVVIAGPPNAGKSSLLNRLARQNRAIVTEIPGTTRDLLHESIQIDGLPLHITDTAGLRETHDEIESEGIRRAREAMAVADLVILVLDSTCLKDGIDDTLRYHCGNPDNERSLSPVIVVLNKSDISGLCPGLQTGENHRIFALSALTGDGVDALLTELKTHAGYHAEPAGTFTARRRHLDALSRAIAALRAGADNLDKRAAGELMAEDLRQAQSALGEITGEVSPDDLLGAIFSSFCIGK